METITLSKYSENKTINKLLENFHKLDPELTIFILAVFVGVVGGLSAVIFRFLIYLVYLLFIDLPAHYFSGVIPTWLIIFIVPGLCGIFVGVITVKVSKEAKGHGIPEIVYAVEKNEGNIRMRVPFAKLIASALTLGSGGSAGREGPIAQIGGGFGSAISQKLKLTREQRKDLVLSGVAAGISATFNAPIGGVLFALEVIRRDDKKPPLIPLIVSSVVGTAIGIVFFGNGFSFNFPTALSYESAINIPFFIILGLITGLISIVWIKGFYFIEDGFDLLQEKIPFKKIDPQIIVTSLGGLLVGIISATLFLTGFPLIYWIDPSPIVKINAIQTVNHIFTNNSNTGLTLTIAVLIILFLASFFATAFSLGSGGSGGIFAPTLFLGIMMGAIYGNLLNFLGINQLSANIALFGVLGMAGLFAGSSRAPLTAVIITAEMVGDFLIIIPLMFTVVTSFIVSKLIFKNDIFVVKLLRRGITFKKDESMDLLDLIKVEEAMTPAEKMISVSAKSRLEEVLALVQKTNHEGFPVIDDGRLRAVITLSDVHKALESSPKEWNVGNIIENKPIEKRLICTHKDAPLSYAGAIMERHDISRLPIVEKIDDGELKLVGWLTNHDILHSFVSSKAESELEKLEEFQILN